MEDKSSKIYAMGLESDTIFPDEIFDQNQKLPEVKTHLQQVGWEDTNFGFSLARKNNGVDMQRGDRRILIYPTSPKDLESYKLLETNDLPQFEVLSQFDTIEGQLNPLRIVGVASNARALDGMRYIEQQPVTGYLGAIEIMMTSARFLAELYKKTGMLPREVTLDKLALVVGKSGIIRLIPPLELVPTEDWHQIAQQLQRSLNEQDPISKHENQIKAFEANFEEFLLND
jgi:hypothetical protein